MITTATTIKLSGAKKQASKQHSNQTTNKQTNNKNTYRHYAWFAMCECECVCVQHWEGNENGTRCLYRFIYVTTKWIFSVRALLLISAREKKRNEEKRRKRSESETLYIGNSSFSRFSISIIISTLIIFVLFFYCILAINLCYFLLPSSLMLPLFQRVFCDLYGNTYYTLQLQQ